MSESITEYRILPHKTFIADLYLQFKRTRVVKTWFGFGKEKEIIEWCYIPEKSYPEVFGYWLSTYSAPSKLPFGREAEFISCFAEQESFDVIPFTKRYPDIEQYFEHLRNIRQQYLETKERQRKNRKVQYLSLLFTFILVTTTAGCTVVEQDCKTDVEVRYKSTGILDTVEVKGKTPHLHKNGCLYAQGDAVVCDVSSARKLNVNCK